MKSTLNFNTFIKNMFLKVNWESILQHIASVALQLILLTVVLLLINWIGKKIIRHIFKTGLRSTKATISPKKLDTIYTLVLNIFKYILMFFWIYAILSAIGIPVGTLIAGAGIFSLAIGLGAQGFVSDMVNGFFILLEQQISVGDTIKINSIEGQVTYVGIRTTQIQSVDGTLNYIPNRNITIVSNKSRNNMQALMEIPISSAAPFDEITRIISDINKNLDLEKLQITKRPYIVGFSNQADGTLVIQVAAYTKPGAQYHVKNVLLENYLSTIRDAKIELPK
ncbi:mechanosensitive ion channel family protein [Companilactobacillus crustorum]|uniref:mechanosensitive ion channel family protein n=1 Tax=Companilactobacillus crustorum TaxID=392416 RepID=UPI00237D8210|nr:mechanosensitive ion channel family protein [Companilactobacillus crustorum]WDT65662.1 mechanosensitive ion channel family protein [Companilactobacillus crustorum]